MNRIIYGINPVYEALKVRPDEFEKIIVKKGKWGKRLREIVEYARKLGIKIEYADNVKLKKLSMSDSYQGILGILSEYRYRELEEIIELCKKSNSGSTIVVLDEIIDPQNLGSLIRSAECFGVKGIVIPKNRAVHITPAVIKASAGAIEYIPISKVNNLANAIDYLKEKGFWVIGTGIDSERGISLIDIECGNLVIVIGSESKGIRHIIKHKCDFYYKIPMEGAISSLNASVAGGIIMYEILKKRKDLRQKNIKNNKKD